MTSNTECYVYITLPRQTDFVAAGKFSLGKDRRGTPIGRFVYGRNCLAQLISGEPRVPNGTWDVIANRLGRTPEAVKTRACRLRRRGFRNA